MSSIGYDPQLTAPGIDILKMRELFSFAKTVEFYRIADHNTWIVYNELIYNGFTIIGVTDFLLEFIK